MNRNIKHAVKEQMWTIEQLEPKLLLSADLIPGIHEITGNIEKSGEQKQYEFIVTEKTKFFIDITKSLEEQAKNTVTLFNDVLMVARNSIYDKKASIALNIKNNIESLEELITKHSRDDLSGDPMWQKMIDDVFDRNQLERKIPYATSCFVAGTLVHTDKGLVPIEQLKVGDLVLSMPEDGSTEEKVYKRVIRNFKSPTKQPVMGNFEGCVFCTGDHPFATIPTVDGYYAADDAQLMWKAAQYVNQEDLIYTLGGDEGWRGRMSRYENDSNALDPYGVGGLYLLATSVEDVAIYCAANDGRERAWYLYDFRFERPTLIQCRPEQFGDSVSPELVHMRTEYEGNPDTITLDCYQDAGQIEFYSQAIRDMGKERAYTAYVYGIEVEDYHTYFVHDEGVWVHNANCQQGIIETVTKTRI